MKSSVRIGIPRTFYNGKEYRVTWNANGLLIERGEFKRIIPHVFLNTTLSSRPLAAVIRDELEKDNT